MRQEALHAMENVKLQAVMATLTTTSGMLTLLDYLPKVLGVVATFLGLVLTWVMISKVGLERKKTKIEIALMRKELECEKCKNNRRGNKNG